MLIDPWVVILTYFNTELYSTSVGYYVFYLKDIYGY